MEHSPGKDVSVTPTQLRAFAAVVRLGSVKRAAAELNVSEAAVSLHVGQLRKELGDQLFTRTAAGLAFTRGGLRLASRAAEMLGLQNQTIMEVRQSGSGRRLLRLAASSLFAEHAAPGLIEMFAGRAADLDVELSEHRSRDFAGLLRARAIDVAIGPQPAEVGDDLVCTPFLNYRIDAVVGPDHPMAKISAGAAELRQQTWLLGPSAAVEQGPMAAILRRLAIPEDRQQIFQSHAAALGEAKRGNGIALALSFVVARDIAEGVLKSLSGPMSSNEGVWCVLSLADRGGGPSPAAELARFATSPRATQAMIRGAGVTVGRFRPSIHVTLWS